MYTIYIKYKASIINPRILKYATLEMDIHMCTILVTEPN